MRMIKVVSVALSLVFALASISFASPALQKGKAPAVTQKNVISLHQVKGSKLLSTLQSRLRTSSDQQTLPVIITLKKVPSTKGLQTLTVKGASTSFTPTRVYKSLPMVAAKLTKAQIQALSKSPDVKQIEYDERVTAFSQTANNWYGTAKARTDFGVDGDRDGNPTSYSKNDVVIAVIDTGIDASHMDLDGGKVIGWKDFVNNKTTPYDDQGHGTHVSSIAAGSGDANENYKGVAPGAALVGVKVLDSNGSGSLSTVVAGIDWAISNKNTYGIQVINMSLGSSQSSDGKDAVSQAANRASDAGIVMVVAAGNSGPSQKTVGAPAAAEKALTVGATADVGEGGFNLAYFSSRGPTADGRIKPDIAAPGFNIMAAKANSTREYVSYSGTSMATPFTAGTAALILDANPNLTVSEVISTITSTATDFGPTGKDNEYGSGNLNGYSAIALAGNFEGTGPEVPDHLFKQDRIQSFGGQDEWTFNLQSTQYPISIAMIISDWSFASFKDFDIYLYDPSGTEVGKSDGVTRQETISFKPTKTGEYKLRVRSYFGSGNYFFDLSGSASNLVLKQNN